MANPDFREIERQVDAHRAEIKATLDDQTIPDADKRDKVMRLTGQVEALEPVARQLRDEELENAQRAAQMGKPLSVDQSAAIAQKEAFNGFLKTGDIQNAALTTSPDANGGYLVPDPLVADIVDIVRAINPILAEATVFNLTKPGTNKVDLPRKSTATAGGWVAPTAARPATDAPTLGQKTLTAHEWYAYPEATQQFLDVVAGADTWLIEDIADTMAATLGTGFAVGTGDANNQPEGLFTASAFYTPTLSSTVDSLDAAQLLGAYFALPAKYLPTAKWYANGATFAALSGLAWPNLSDTPLVRWENNVPSIMGKPCVITDSAPAIANGAFPLAFGDLRRGYAVGIHSALSVLRDPFTNKPYVGFYSTGRAGGVPWDPKAVLLLKSDNA